MDGSPKKVLVVDDDLAILKLMKLQLESAGYSVVCVSDPKLAIETAKTNHVFAMLLDLHIAGGDGFDILQQSKKQLPQLPVIMVTGSHEEQEARKAFELGAWDYVTKPIDFNYLKNILLMQSSQ